MTGGTYLREIYCHWNIEYLIVHIWFTLKQQRMSQRVYFPNLTIRMSVKKTNCQWTSVIPQVNGNLVSPMHVLANAEVVEIITYNVCLFDPYYMFIFRLILIFWNDLFKLHGVTLLSCIESLFGWEGYRIGVELVFKLFKKS